MDYRDNEPFITPKIKCPFCERHEPLELEIDEKDPHQRSQWICMNGLCQRVFRAYKSPDGWELGEEI